METNSNPNLNQYQKYVSILNMVPKYLSGTKEVEIGPSLGIYLL